MTVKRTFLFLFILALLLGSCTPGQATGIPAASPPTPTLHPAFSGKNLVSLPQTAASGQRPVDPRFSAAFNPGPTPGSTLAATPVPDRNAGPGAVRSHLELPSTPIPVYEGGLNPDWLLLSSGVEIHPDFAPLLYQGKKSIQVIPAVDYGAVTFAVRPGASTTYQRDLVLGVEFWLNGGDAPVRASDLAVSVLGSNQNPYYVPGDVSVTNRVDPVFPETRLYYLGIADVIPANTWVEIVVWMDSLVYDPIYDYVTAFTIKNDEGFRTPYYIADARVVLLDQQAAPVTGLSGETGQGSPGSAAPVNIEIDVHQNNHPISPLIYGVSSAPAEILADLKPGLTSWGGNPSTRYNWKLGDAWNAARDYLYQNTSFGSPPGQVSDRFLVEAQKAKVAVRLALPTLGWVAKNSKSKTCSFPLPDGSCGDADGASCINPGEIADPNRANVPSNVDSITAWVKHILTDKKFPVKIFALDNEPELWGITHYDVHPRCTTYQEILQKYIEYARAVRRITPAVELAGPVTCCWFYYWNSAAGEMDKLSNGNKDFIPWFLEQVHTFDVEKGTRTIDVLDIHYYPEGLYNQNVDPQTAAHRLRATRSLWDPAYRDESWINAPVSLIPRMKAVIAANYPGLKLGISEWNFGADKDINGALAIADVLGIFAREDVYYANYWTYPPQASPGAFAFQMYTNYDGKGSGFGDVSVQVNNPNPDLIGAFAALERKTGQLHLVIVNKNPVHPVTVALDLLHFGPAASVLLYRYSAEEPGRIVFTDEPGLFENSSLTVPPYSISHYILIP